MASRAINKDLRLPFRARRRRAGLSEGGRADGGADHPDEEPAAGRRKTLRAPFTWIERPTRHSSYIRVYVFFKVCILISF